MFVLSGNTAAPKIDEYEISGSTYEPVGEV